jgi:ribonuclease HII
MRDAHSRQKVRKMPDFSLENRAQVQLVAGVDEAGRGPLAGPVVAAAVLIDLTNLCEEIFVDVNDSKQMSRAKRQLVHERLTALTCVSVGEASVAEIDHLNILAATLLAMRRAVLGLPRPPQLVLVDGNQRPHLDCPVRCVVGGDGRSLSIAAASIVAKVTRDRIMAALAAAYPAYGWERNAGYPTKEHRLAVTRHGVTPHHRRSFQPITRIWDEFAPTT